MADNKSIELVQPHGQPDAAFTVLGRGSRIYFTYLLSYLTLASSLTATIYLPLIEPLSRQYNTSVQAINLTITLYVVFQAISPAFFAPLSDTLGRRPVFLLTFSIYCVASIGLAFNKNSYAALVVLRSIQSIGGSAVMSLAYAVVADISVSSERGKILGPMLAATNFGPCFGPVIGGGVVMATGLTQWCFWTLVIFGVSSFLLIGWTMQETGRNIVGNGSVLPKGVWRTWWYYLRHISSRNARSYTPGEIRSTNATQTGRGKICFPNPLSSVRLVLYADTFLILWSAGSPYAVWYSLQVSIPIIYGTQYGYNAVDVSLCFLSGGAGVIAGSFIAGRLMDFNYQKIARLHGLPVDRVTGDDMRNFPIETARSHGCYLLHVFSICALAGYGWAVDRHVHPSVPLILQFFIGIKCTVVLQLFSTLMIDIFSQMSGTAAASNNIMRCMLSAILVAVLQPLDRGLGKGWTFTLVGLIDGSSGILAVWLLQNNGRKWRLKREDCD
jgi:MFS family permease